MRTRAFAYSEVLIVIALIGIILSIISVVIYSQMAKSRDKAKQEQTSP